MQQSIDLQQIQRVLAPSASGATDEELWLAGAAPELSELLRAAMPARRTPAAVLVPLIERETGIFVLLTQRADSLKDHAGQISFPGGRIETTDKDAWSAALRESREEIGLSERFVQFAGFLPDHIVITGFRVTPVVGFVSPDYRLQLDAAEVLDAFEVPLSFILDSKNHQSRQRTIGELKLEVYDIPYGERNIWGATAGMLMTLRSLLIAGDVKSGLSAG